MTDIRQAEGSGAAPGEAGQGHGSVYDRSIAAGNPRKGAEHSTPGRTSSQSIQEALQHVAGGDAPTAVRCGLGPAGGRLPGLAPVLDNAFRPGGRRPRRRGAGVSPRSACRLLHRKSRAMLPLRALRDQHPSRTAAAPCSSAHCDATFVSLLYYIAVFWSLSTPRTFGALV